MTVVEHTTVFAEPNTYAGWPANHGAWQWGDEFLVGLLRGRYGRGYLHNVREPFQKVLARSLDGGRSWSVEVPNVDFEGKAVELMSTPLDLTRDIVRVCGRYDHGGERCHQNGAFYVSSDKGHSWSGPYAFNGLEPLFSKETDYGLLQNTSRTRVVGDLWLLSSAVERHWGSDFTFCARRAGDEFRLVGEVCNDHARCVMPAVAKVGDRIVVTARRRGPPRVGGWIDAFVSDDAGLSWRFTSCVDETGKDNGNPPALIEANGNLYCAYANRSEKTVNVSISEDGGEKWTGFKLLRKGKNSDIGYPQLFKRTDGTLVCVYYWSDERGDPQRIEATAFAP